MTYTPVATAHARCSLASPAVPLPRLALAALLAASALLPRVASAAPPPAPAPAPPSALAPPPAPPPNRPPRWLEGPRRELGAKTGVPLHLDLVAVDPDLDALVITVQGAPAGASFVPASGASGSASFDWTPSAQDAGARDLVFTASDGKSEVAHTVHLRVDDEWSGFFMPGAKYSTYVPAAVGKWGFFHGVSAEIRAYSWIRKNAGRGPSHGTVYLDLDLLSSTRANVANAFHLSTGIELSFESNPARRYLLPVYGLELGALFQRQVLTTLGEITPTTGLYLWAGPHLVIDLRVGYLLPLHAATFDELRGLRAKLGVTISSW